MATVEELLKEAEQNLEKGDLDQAAALFEQAHVANKEQPYGAIGMAKVAILLGDYEAGMQILDAVLKRFPKNAEAMSFRGVVDEGFGRIPAALGWYEKAVKLDPKLAVAHFNFGRALGQQGRWKEAVRELQIATRNEPNNLRFWDSLGIAYKESGDLPRAVEAFSNCIDINPLHLNSYLTLADVLSEAGQDDMAQQALENARTLFPEQGPVHGKLAVLAIKRKDFKAATDHLKDQTETQPDNIEHWLSLSFWSMLVPDFETAGNAALKALELNPNDWRGHYYLGTVYDASRAVDKAKESFKRAIECAPEQWKPYNNLGNLIAESSDRTELETAAALFGRALELCPPEEGYQPLYNLALVYFKLGDRDKAKQCAEEAVQNGPEGDEVVEDAKRLLTEFK